MGREITEEPAARADFEERRVSAGQKLGRETRVHVLVDFLEEGILADLRRVILDLERRLGLHVHANLILRLAKAHIWMRRRPWRKREMFVSPYVRLW